MLDYSLRGRAQQSLSKLIFFWAIFKATVEDSDADDIICFIDGLDECENSSGNELMILLVNHFPPSQPPFDS